MHLSSVDLVRVARRRPPPPGEAESLRGTINLSRHGMIIGEEHFFVQCTILGEANQLACLYVTDKRSEKQEITWPVLYTDRIKATDGFQC